MAVDLGANPQDNGPGSILDPLSTFTGPGTDPRYLPGGQFYNAINGLNYDPQTSQAISNVQSAIDRSGSQLQAGNSSLDNQYNTALQQLLLGKNQGQATYNQSTQGNATNYIGAKNTIGANAGSTLNGLLRLLGARGAGGSSAYNIAAPQAVTRGASLQRSDAGTNYGQNQQSLDTNWNNYLTGYNNQVTGVGAQRDQGKQTLANNINSNKANLLQTLAGLQSSASAAQPYLNQANSLLDQSANYTTPQINYSTAAYTPPALSSYNTGGTSPTFNQGSGGDYFSPYLSALLGKRQPAVA